MHVCVFSILLRTPTSQLLFSLSLCLCNIIRRSTSTSRHLLIVLTPTIVAMKMTTAAALPLAWLALSAVLLCGSAADAASAPNIVYILVDDWGTYDASFRMRELGR